MVRNLVREKDEKAQEAKPEEPKAEDKPQAQPTEVKVITFEALIANNLDALHQKLDVIGKMVLEGFKQVGVKFPEDK